MTLPRQQQISRKYDYSASNWNCTVDTHVYIETDTEILIFIFTTLISNKKVLLCERKRHTARRVVSTPYVVLTGYPPCPDLVRGYPAGGCPGGGYPTWVTPWQGTPSWLGGGTQVGYPQQGTPLTGYPSRVPPWQGTPAGYPLAGYPPAGYPPSWPGRVPPHLDLAGYPLGYPSSRVPPW